MVAANQNRCDIHLLAHVYPRPHRPAVLSLFIPFDHSRNAMNRREGPHGIADAWASQAGCQGRGDQYISGIIGVRRGVVRVSSVTRQEFRPKCPGNIAERRIQHSVQARIRIGPSDKGAAQENARKSGVANGLDQNRAFVRRGHAIIAPDDAASSSRAIRAEPSVPPGHSNT